MVGAYVTRSAPDVGNVFIDFNSQSIPKEFLVGVHSVEILGYTFSVCFVTELNSIIDNAFCYREILQQESVANVSTSISTQLYMLSAYIWGHTLNIYCRM